MTWFLASCTCIKGIKMFRGVSDVGFPIFADADTDADFAF